MGKLLEHVIAMNGTGIASKGCAVQNEIKREYIYIY